jgi:hypothetical protein
MDETLLKDFLAADCLHGSLQDAFLVLCSQSSLSAITSIKINRIEFIYQFSLGWRLGDFEAISSAFPRRQTRDSRQNHPYQR